MARRNQKIQYNEKLDRCTGVGCKLRQWCYRYVLDEFYNDPNMCKNPPAINWWVDPKFDGESCKNFLEVEYKR